MVNGNVKSDYMQDYISGDNFWIIFFIWEYVSFVL